MSGYQGKLETVDCVLCPSHHSDAYLTVNGWTLVRCRQCQLIYLNPRPPADELPQLYTSEYFNEYITGDGAEWPTDPQAIEAKIIAQTLRICRLEQYAHPPGRLLDIGCGPGFFLACAARSGWEVQGIDISRWAADYAQEHLKLNVQVGTPNEIDDSWPDQFDVITMFHVLEHLPDPLTALRTIRSELRGSGIILVTVPNIGGFDARYHGAYWDGLRMPHHLYHFTPHTLRQLLEEAGFKVMAVDKQPSLLVANWIKQLLRKNLSGNHGHGEVTNSIPGLPRISNTSKIYSMTLGRLFPGRTMTTIARKAG